mgnify:CR=1 FL=1
MEAEVQRVAREQLEAARNRRAKATADVARTRHMNKLARDIDGGWARLTKLVEKSQYEQAMMVAIDLRDLAVRDGDQATFAARFAALRKSQMRRRGFFDRWKRMEKRP